MDLLEVLPRFPYVRTGSDDSIYDTSIIEVVDSDLLKVSHKKMLVHNMTSLVRYIRRLEREVIVAITQQYVRVEQQKTGTNMMITR